MRALITTGTSLLILSVVATANAGYKTTRNNGLEVSVSDRVKTEGPMQNAVRKSITSHFKVKLPAGTKLGAEKQLKMLVRLQTTQHIAGVKQEGPSGDTWISLTADGKGGFVGKGSMDLVANKLATVSAQRRAVAVTNLAHSEWYSDYGNNVTIAKPKLK